MQINYSVKSEPTNLKIKDESQVSGEEVKEPVEEMHITELDKSKLSEEHITSKHNANK